MTSPAQICAINPRTLEAALNGETHAKRLAAIVFLIGQGVKEGKSRVETADKGVNK